MTEETKAPAYEEGYSIGKYVSGFLYKSYVIMLVFSVAILLAGLFLGRSREILVTIAVIIALLDALYLDKKVIHIPPLMVFVMVWLMVLIVIGKLYGGDGAVGIVMDIAFGALLGLVGLIFTYSLAPASLDITREKLFRIIFLAFSIALSAFTLLLIVQYVFDEVFGLPVRDTGEIMAQLLPVILGALVISALFCMGRNSPRVGKAVTKYLIVNDAILGVDEYEKVEIEKAIASGENEKVEFKSTLRINLSTGEKDEKIEWAVLKTLVAFLNSRGGTLLIGIADNGSVIGIDEWSFETRDKLSLHFTNIVAEHIGNEYLPFITFRLSDYDGKGVMRIICKKSDIPVFLKMGKNESFYVRSGPSSVELHGKDTLKYVDSRFKKRSGKLFKV